MDINDWRAQSLCGILAKTDPTVWKDAWFAPEDSHEAEAATGVCFACPVKGDCLSFAIETSPRWGIWGGIPASLRSKYKARLEALYVLDNPYNTTNPKSRFHVDRLHDWVPDLDEGE